MASREKIEMLAVDVINRHSNYSQELKDKWTELYNRYENQLRKSSITAETEAKVRLGAAYALVENFVSKVIAQNPRFRYLARERGDSKPAEIYNEFSDYQHDQARSQEEFEEIAKWGGICGLAGFKMGWVVEDIVRKKRGKEIMGKKVTNPILVDMAEKLNIGKDVKIDDTERISNWTIKAIRPHDLIWDTNFSSWDDSPVKGHRVRKTYGEMKAEGYDMRKVANLIKGQNDYWREQMTKYPLGTTQGEIMDYIPLEVAELYVENVTESGVSEGYVVTMAGLSELASVIPTSIRFEVNPFDKQFCPVGAFRPIKRPGKVEGFGVVEPVEGILDAEEDTYNMNIEASWTDVSRPMEYVPDNVLNEAELQYKPRTLVPVKELGKSIAVMATPRPDLGAASFLLNYAVRAKQNVSAITDYQTGANQANQGAQTATEVNTKTFLSEQRLNKILRSFETEVLEVSGKMALWLNQQYLSDSPKIVYRILGKKGSILENQIKFKDIEAVKDLAIISGSSAYMMQQEQRNKWASLLQLSAQEMALPVGGVPIDRETIWKNLLEEGYFIKDSENYIPSLKEREEATVAKKLANLEDAKQENLDPATARVLPDDIHSVHISLHKAALQGQGSPDANGQVIPYTPEQMVLLTSHLNAHVAQVGGAMSPMNVAMDQAMGQKVNNQVNPNGQVQGVSGGQAGGGQASAGPAQPGM